MATKKTIDNIDITRTVNDFSTRSNEFYVDEDCGIMYGDGHIAKTIIPKDIFIIAYQKFIVENQ